jgi:hypothetical protein
MSNGQTPTSQADPQATNYQRRVRRRRSYVLRNTAYVVIMVLLLAVTAKFAAERILQPVSRDDVQVDNLADAGVGSISQQTDKGRCELMKFDNYSGRTIENSKHCETIVRDARGIPVPVGTVHRLDSISKSFTGDSH